MPSYLESPWRIQSIVQPKAPRTRQLRRLSENVSLHATAWPPRTSHGSFSSDAASVDGNPQTAATSPRPRTRPPPPSRRPGRIPAVPPVCDGATTPAPASPRLLLSARSSSQVSSLRLMLDRQDRWVSPVPARSSSPAVADASLDCMPTDGFDWYEGQRGPGSLGLGHHSTLDVVKTTTPSCDRNKIMLPRILLIPSRLSSALDNGPLPLPSQDSFEGLRGAKKLASASEH